MTSQRAHTHAHTHTHTHTRTHTHVSYNVLKRRLVKETLWKILLQNYILMTSAGIKEKVQRRSIVPSIDLSYFQKYSNILIEPVVVSTFIYNLK